MKKNLLMLAGVLALTLTACNSKKETENTEAKADSLENVVNEADQTSTAVTNEALEGTWVLNAITTPETSGKEFADLYKDKIPTLTFHPSEFKVEGNDGCNGIGGTYESKEGNSISIGDKLVATMMHCEGVAYNEFLSGLKTVTNFDVQGNELVFISGDIVVMKFTKQ